MSSVLGRGPRMNLLEAAVAGEGWRKVGDLEDLRRHRRSVCYFHLCLTLTFPGAPRGDPALPMVWRQRSWPGFCHFVSLFLCACSVPGSELSILTSYLVLVILQGGTVLPPAPHNRLREVKACAPDHTAGKSGDQVGSWSSFLLPLSIGWC